MIDRSRIVKSGVIDLVIRMLIALAATSACFAQTASSQRSYEVQDVDYCTLRQDPETYNGKTIRVSGIYRRGFEVSAFYSKACTDDQRLSQYETWVYAFFGGPIDSDLETKAIVQTFRSGKDGDEIEVTITGVFRGTKEHGGFGHLGGSKFQIEAVRIEKAKLLPEELGGCRRIDKTKPFHYLSYEKVAKGTPPSYGRYKAPKQENLIYIRLANNSTCSITVPTFPITNSNGLEDGNEVPIIYTLSSPCARVAWRSIIDAKHVASKLAPGRAVYFTVPLRLLTKEPYDVRIPFDKAVVKDKPFYEPFYFWRSDLPERLSRDLDCTKY